MVLRVSLALFIIPLILCNTIDKPIDKFTDNRIKIRIHRENISSSVKRIKRISFGNKTGKEVSFKPKFPDEIGANDYFANILSPKKDFVVLCQGKFNGFCLFSTKNLLTKIKSNQYDHTVTIIVSYKGKNKKRIINQCHEFIKWENNHTIKFKAGLSNTFYIFFYDFEKDQVYSNSSNISNFFWINKNDKIHRISAKKPNVIR